ncbi:MAG TPA: cysteine desulfurase family protein [Acidimicrobiia bacterium]
MRRAYLDHASTSRLRPAALEAMLPFLREHHADPGRLHAEGKVTRVALEQAREQVAAFVGARPREVVFTSSGTEAINTAVWGAVARAGGAGRPHVVTTAVEHSAVLDACRRGPGEIAVVGVDGVGRFDPAEVIDAIRPETALVSVQLANHEVGTVQAAAAVAAACRDRGALVHVDACMAVGHVPVDFAALGADLCSITAHKLGGPKGAGALLIRRGLRIPQLVVGGAQERVRRGGLENVPAAVGFGAAAAELGASDRLAAEAEASRRLTQRAGDHAVARVPGVVRYGDPDDRVPNLVCLGIEGVEAEPVLLGLDQQGVAVHSGSACSSEALEPSPILAAMGVDADHSLRVSVGWDTTDADVDRFLDTFPAVVDRLRALRAG